MNSFMTKTNDNNLFLSSIPYAKKVKNVVLNVHIFFTICAKNMIFMPNDAQYNFKCVLLKHFL